MLDHRSRFAKKTGMILKNVKRLYLAKRLCLIFIAILTLSFYSLIFSEYPEEIIKPKVLFGILTTADKLARRNLIRTTYFKQKPLHIDFYFVVGKPDDDSRLLQLEYESKVYQDIMVLNCTENMNEGKTFWYFTKAAEYDVDYVIKADDDAWIQLHNWYKKIKEYPRDGVYFGRASDNWKFMVGMGYGLSMDLVKWIASEVKGKIKH